MKTIVISITVPDGVNVQVASGPAIPPSDFEHEPLPTDTFATEQEFTGGAPVSSPPAPIPAPANGGVTPFRGAAMQQPSTAHVWSVGEIHANGHRPLKMGRSGHGVYCPTPLGKLPDGNTQFCDFRA